MRIHTSVVRGKPRTPSRVFGVTRRMKPSTHRYSPNTRIVLADLLIAGLDFRRAALYLDSLSKCEQVGTGDSPRCLGSPRPSVSRGVVRSHRSSKVRTVGRARKPASCKVGSRRAGPEEAR